MGSIGTFGSFTQARLAIYAAQLGLSVTGNNISNVNTPGYTRQQLEQVSFKTGGADRYQSSYEIRIGNGVLPTGVSQLRDPYLDIRFRNDNSNVGAMDAKLGGLEKIAAILDEVGKGGDVKEGEEFGIIAYQIENLFQAISGLTDYTGQKEYDVQVRTAADSLCQELRSYAAQLKELHDDSIKQFNQDIQTVNNLLTNIRDLNASIRKSDIHGDNALELRDQRNNLIDELSNYIKIDAIYTTEDIGAGKTVEKLIIKMGDANPDSGVSTDESVLINGRYCTQLGYTQVPKIREEDPDDPSTFAYVAEDGTLTNDPAAAEMLPTPNPDTADTAHPYLNDKGEPVADADDALWIPKANPDYLPYLDADGNPTADLEQAQTMDSPNFDITLSELRDVYGAIYEEVVKMQERTLSDTSDEVQQFLNGVSEITKVNDDGTVTVTTVRASLVKSLKVNPTYDPDDPTSGRYLKTVTDENGVTSEVPTSSAAEADRVTKTYYFAQDYIKTRSTPVDLDDNDLYGSLQSQRELLTEAGEFTSLDTIANVDENAATKRGIPYYQNVLDLLAQQIATSFNDANQGYLMDNNGVYITQGVNAKGEAVGTPLTFHYTDATGNPVQATDKDGNLLWQEKTDANGDVIYFRPGDAGVSLWDLDGDGNPVNLYDEFGHALWKMDADGAVERDENDEPIPVDQVPDCVPLYGFALTPDTKWEDIPQEVQEQMQANDPTISSVKDYLERGGGTDANGDPIPVGIFRGGNLFSNNGDSDSAEGITAANISVSASWTAGPMVVNSFICPPGDLEPASTDSSNVLTMLGLQSKRLEYFPQNIVGDAQDKAMFTGSFSEMWRNIGATLGSDQKVTSTLLDNYYEKTVELDSSRAAVSSVDFNDEAMNLMQYAKSYNAACRLMTTLDSVLDKLINNTGLTT